MITSTVIGSVAEPSGKLQKTASDSSAMKVPYRQVIEFDRLVDPRSQRLSRSLWSCSSEETWSVVTEEAKL